MGAQTNVDPDFSTGIIKHQLNGVINNLSLRYDELLQQQEKYQLLIDMNSTKKSYERVMVLLGDGYFVEYLVKEANDFLNRRIATMKVGSKEIMLKIVEARKTLAKFEEYSQDENILENFSGEREEKFNEEGLPFMEIREELDEDGNILERKLNDKFYEVEQIKEEREDEYEKTEKKEMQLPEVKQDNKQVLENEAEDKKEEFIASSSPTPENGQLLRANDFSSHENGTKEENKNESALLDPIIERVEEDLPIMEIVEQLDELGAVISLSIKPKEAEELATLPNSKESQEEQVEENEEVDQEEEQISELLQDMEVIGTPNKANEEELLNKLDKLDISDEDKFRLKTILLDEYRKVKGGVEASSSSSATSSDSQDISAPPSINQEDILELELLADDFEENEEEISFADDEEWDFEFSDNGEDNEEDDDEEDDDEEDDDDDLADELLYGGGHAPVISNNGLNSRLWNEVISLRSKQVDGVETIHSVSNKGNKKSVRFASELDIYVIENVSKELKNIQHTNQNHSRFMQERILSRKIEEVDETEEQPASITDIMDEVIDEPKPGRISRFKAMRDTKKTHSSATEIKIEEKEDKYEEIMREPLDIVEREPILATNDRDEVTSDIVERDFTTTDIVEKELTSEVFERNGVASEIIERDEMMSEIFERDEVVSEIFERDEVVSDILERDEAVSDMIDRDNVSEVIENVEVGDIVEKEVIHGNFVEEITNQTENTKNDATSSKSNVFNEVVTDSFKTDVVNDITERETTYEEPTNTSNRKRSRFMMQRKEKVKPQLQNFKSITPQREPIVNGEIFDRKKALEQSIHEVEDKEIEPDLEEDSDDDKVEVNDKEEGKVVVEATMDYRAMQDDMDTMAKAYVLGMYDDDIETQGPVVDTLDDFEKINQIVEAREQEMALKGANNDEDEEEDQDGEDNEDQGPVLGDIIENDIDFYNEDEDDIQDGIIQEEVNNNYHRLRRQLMQSRKDGYRKSEAEQEMEPIDEEGNVIKVSRFRSARLM